MSLREIVFNNLDAARENGYFEPGEMLHGATCDDIAHDLIAYASDCEKISANQLAPHVTEWKQERGVS